jgi:GTPase Era involved in 16S rRNA processing
LSDSGSDSGSVALNGPPSPNKKEERTAVDLIRTEWKIIDALLAMVDNTKDDNKKAFIYQTLQGHTRTLSMLLKTHGQPDQNQDLAKVLSELTKEAKITAKRLKLR